MLTASEVKTGTKFSRISYGTILNKDGSGNFQIQNENGDTWFISAALVEKEFLTPDQFEKVEEVNRTDMIKAVINNPRIVMTVVFKKQADPKELRDVVTNLLQDEKAGRKRPGPRKLSSMLKAATEGQTRTMVGRHYGNLDEFGRIQFTDMEAEGFNLRTVDPRTIEEVIVANVKYVLK